MHIAINLQLPVRDRIEYHQTPLSQCGGWGGGYLLMIEYACKYIDFFFSFIANLLSNDQWNILGGYLVLTYQMEHQRKIQKRTPADLCLCLLPTWPQFQMLWGRTDCMYCQNRINMKKLHRLQYIHSIYQKVYYLYKIQQLNYYYAFILCWVHNYYQITVCFS